MRWPSIKSAVLLLGLLLGSGSAGAARTVYVGFPEAIPPWVQPGGRQLTIEQLGDLARWRVMAWDGAGTALPAGYDRLLALADGNYLEAGNQGHQLVNLLAGRVDVILSDRLIFEWQRRQLLPASLEHTPPLRIYPLLPPKEAGLLFRDSGLRARVDARIRTLKASPQYQAIFTRYGSEAQP
ncbi:hypothetical protein C8E02_3452 [Vogesella indigofera]|uniref:Extracellular solute-binding protein (Family 3) n=1 Tax=Vogesella indigofera TaxID=45465 RepID=A0A495AW67_VOGIN|nr:ABC transporter substrate-binding protein [Vogesella indigofera]RKQ52982.1 hypothetical protein C8E02_3452 [Vogesella indigofera]